MSDLLCMEVWHEGKHVSFAQYPLPPGVVSSLVPHLVMVAAVCIEHLGHVTWGRGIQHVGQRKPNTATHLCISITKQTLENVNMRLRNASLIAKII